MKPVKKLAIDAGHGLGNVRPGKVDPGASFGGHTEAAIVLAYAKTLKHYAALEGIVVHMINTGEDENPVGGRDEQAELAGCDKYLSIHCNAGPTASKGTETLYRDSRDTVFAAIIQKATVQSLKLKDRGLKPETVSPHGRLAVFDFDNGETALVELGFLTNAGDLAAILDEDNRRAWAQAVIGGLSRIK